MFVIAGARSAILQSSVSFGHSTYQISTMVPVLWRSAESRARGRPRDKRGSSARHTEFEHSSDALTTTMQNIVPWPDPPHSDGIRMRLYSMGEDPHNSTVLWMTTARGKIIKARATWTRDHFIDDVARNFLKSISLTVGLSKRIDSQLAFYARRNPCELLRRPSC